jgi:hypothetical protein
MVRGARRGRARRPQDVTGPHASCCRVRRKKRRHSVASSRIVPPCVPFRSPFSPLPSVFLRAPTTTSGSETPAARTTPVTGRGAETETETETGTETETATPELRRRSDRGRGVLRCCDGDEVWRSDRPAGHRCRRLEPRWARRPLRDRSNVRGPAAQEPGRRLCVGWHGRAEANAAHADSGGGAATSCARPSRGTSPETAPPTSCPSTATSDDSSCTWATAQVGSTP